MENDKKYPNIEKLMDIEIVDITSMAVTFKRTHYHKYGFSKDYIIKKDRRTFFRNILQRRKPFSIMDVLR